MGRRTEIKMGWPDDWAFCICDFETTGVDTEKDFPIEVGCIFTDSRFVLLRTFQSIICTQQVVDRIVGDKSKKIVLIEWPDEWRPAYKVHRIPAEYIGLRGEHVDDIATGLTKITSDLRLRLGINRIILLSDNAQFEYRFMRRLFEGKKWPFHYCAWDSSILLEGSGVGDPIPVHRALPDAAILHHALIRACERVGFFGG